jgi:hypothetical protein
MFSDEFLYYIEYMFKKDHASPVHNIQPFPFSSNYCCQHMFTFKVSLTWIDSIKRDLKDWNINKERYLDSSQSKLVILSYPLITSILVYPNFLGAKRLCCCLIVSKCSLNLLVNTFFSHKVSVNRSKILQ